MLLCNFCFNILRDEFVGASNSSGSSESDDDILRVFHVSIPGTFVEVSFYFY